MGVAAIVARAEAGEIALVRSPAHLVENDANPREDRRLAAALWIDGAAVDVPLDADVEARAAELVALGFGPLDALHLAFAERAGVGVGAGQGGQVFHGCVGRQTRPAHARLERGRQFLHQRQAPTHPARRAREAPAEILPRQREPDGELVQQPPVLQRRGALARAHQPVQDECLRLAQIPTRGADQVLPEPAQGPHALVAIHQDKPVGPLAVHDHDRHLLPNLRQRPHQPAFRRGLVRAQLLVAQVQLVQLDVHAAALALSRPAAVWRRQRAALRQPRPPSTPRSSGPTLRGGASRTAWPQQSQRAGPRWRAAGGERSGTRSGGSSVGLAGESPAARGSAEPRCVTFSGGSARARYSCCRRLWLARPGALCW